MAQRDLILMGPPGAGKGTHAEYLEQHLSYAHLSTGDLLREAVAAQTELGKQGQSYMDAGELVPDELVISLVRERLAQLDISDRFLLDGFPRTVAQAEALGRLLDDLSRGQPLVINLVVSDEEMVRRLGGRRLCEECGAIYNVHRDGLDVGDECPRCGGELYRRTDDEPQAVRRRLQVYKEQTAPLITYYQQRGQIVMVDAEQGQQQVSEELAELVEGGASKADND